MIKYDEEQKSQALLLVKEIGITKASRELHIANQTLRKWRSQAAGKEESQQMEFEAATENSLLAFPGSKPRVERIETIMPDASRSEEKNAESSKVSTNPGMPQEEKNAPQKDEDTMIRLKTENAELKLRISLLKKSLASVLEALSSL